MQPNPLIDVQDIWITNYSQFSTLLFSDIFGRFWIIACYFATNDDIVYLVWFLYSQHFYHSHTLPDRHSMQSQIKSHFGIFTENLLYLNENRNHFGRSTLYNLTIFCFQFCVYANGFGAAAFFAMHTLSKSKIKFYYCALLNPNGKHVRIIANIAT